MEPKNNNLKMEIQEFTELNKGISDLIDKLQKYDNTDITTAIKNLKDAGKRIGESFYRYEQKEETKLDLKVEKK